MFSFFSKKKYLIDYMEGFIDIHNHILPSIDDGAKTVEDSISLIKEFSEFGVTKFIATPHIMNNYYPNTPETINNSLLLLKDELLKRDLRHVSIEASAEHMIDDNFESILEEGKVMPIRKMYLLVEMSYLQASINFDEAIQKVAKNRYFPILAHPERYMYLHNNFSKYLQYKKDGILFQMNFLSLSDFYGKEVQKKAVKLLEDESIDFVATDIHNIHQMEKLKEMRVSNSILKLLLPVIEKTIGNFY